MMERGSWALHVALLLHPNGESTMENPFPEYGLEWSAYELSADIYGPNIARLAATLMKGAAYGGEARDHVVFSALAELLGNFEVLAPVGGAEFRLELHHLITTHVRDKTKGLATLA